VYVLRNSQIILPRRDVLIATALVLEAGVLVLIVQFHFPWLAQFTHLTDSTIGSARHP
jgi:hypothetical protein